MQTDQISEMQKIHQLSRILSRSQFCFPISPFSSAPIEPPQPLLSIGHVLRASRIFTGQDVAHYAEITGDYNPVHLDSEFATSVAGFDRGRVVHGMLVASLFPSIIASNFVCSSSHVHSSFSHLGFLSNTCRAYARYVFPLQLLVFL